MLYYLSLGLGLGLGLGLEAMGEHWRPRFERAGLAFVLMSEPWQLAHSTPLAL
jgi:hypothetical protein